MFEIGDKVKLNDKYHVNVEDRDRIFEVRSNPRRGLNGKEFVALYGKSGGYAVDGLEKVNIEHLRHGEWLNTCEHDWEKDRYGDINMFALDFDYHNGPHCEVCGKSYCEHCEPDWATTECVPHFKCPVCGRHEKKRFDFCRCGAKMRGDC